MHLSVAIFPTIDGREDRGGAITQHQKNDGNAYKAFVSHKTQKQANLAASLTLPGSNDDVE